jgi:phenylalanyl-tRNA synthetase beta chain
MRTLLTNVEFAVDVQGDDLVVAAPFWRTDIEIPEDVVEEVGRLYGYDHLSLDLPHRNLTPANRNPLLQLKSKLREALARAGANELLTYSFVHGNLIDKVGQKREQAFQISNALSPDLQYYRLSLTPGLLDKVHANSKAGYDQFALFEIGESHIIGHEDAEGLPIEFERLACVLAAGPKAQATLEGAAFYQARTYLMRALHTIGVEAVTLTPLNTDDADPASAYYQPGRAATITVDGVVIGRIGEYKASVRKALKLPEYCAGFELGLQPLLELSSAVRYQALPRFPRVEQDICLKVPAATTYAEVYEQVASYVAEHRPDQTYYSVNPLDIYQRDDDQEHKQITLRVHIASYERTLTDGEVSKLLDGVAAAAADALRAERV